MNLAYILAEALTQVLCLLSQVYDQNRDMLMLDWEKHEAVLPSASIPVATDKVDVAKLALVKQILEDHQKQKHAMMRHLQQRKSAKVLKQIEAAARYNAAHEQLQVHNAGKQNSILQFWAAQQRLHALENPPPCCPFTLPIPPPLTTINPKTLNINPKP